MFLNSEKKNIPVTHEVISRDDEELTAYETWKNSKRKKRIVALIKAVIDGNSLGEDQLEINIVESQGIRGFVLKFHNQVFDTKDFQHLFDYFKEKMLEEAYASYMSDTRSQIEANIVVIKERHYLKPKFNFDNEQNISDQRYGNITIEHIVHDDQPKQLRFISNTYHDHKYKPAREFDELLSHLLE